MGIRQHIRGRFATGRAGIFNARFGLPWCGMPSYTTSGDTASVLQAGDHVAARASVGCAQQDRPRGHLERRRSCTANRRHLQRDPCRRGVLPKSCPLSGHRRGVVGLLAVEILLDARRKAGTLPNRQRLHRALRLLFRVVPRQPPRPASSRTCGHSHRAHKWPDSVVLWNRRRRFASKHDERTGRRTAQTAPFHFFSFQHCSYDGAGHLLAGPSRLAPAASISAGGMTFGGTENANAAAREKAWTKVCGFFGAYL